MKGKPDQWFYGLRILLILLIAVYNECYCRETQKGFQYELVQAHSTRFLQSPMFTPFFGVRHRNLADIFY